MERGDLWVAGAHRMLCGDCTDEAAVGRLLEGEKCHICWTDPPWNVNYGKAPWARRNSGKLVNCYKQRSITNDNMGADFPAFVAQFCTSIAAVVQPGAPAYVVMSAQEWPVIDRGLREAGFHWSSTIIWVKQKAVFSMKDYHTRYEPLWYGWREGTGRLCPLEDRKQNDVWEIMRPDRSDEHPTMKPVELVTRALKNSSRAGDLVFEPFLGSGTTAVAAEQTGRICYGMEIEPKYVAVTLERLAGMGLEPRLTE